ncbi:hypothetical protein SteCoe_14871 [Stentor coeruleus]|uniref:cGMP-dependent protein kinase n=1 Tax=Stentor coeruleus TaxID=5963 RepID=A0A1R2C503_9CILI|nr:hypothetical protein SteCoe_14871 [Stentor coeruleus]
MGNCSNNTKLRKKHRKQASSTITIDLALEVKVGSVKEKSPSKISKSLIENSLKNHYLFSDLTSEDLNFIIGSLKYYTIPSKEYVFQQGDIGSTFFIVEQGKLEVIRNGIKKTILQKGESFGDMSLLTDFPRRATIKTIEESALWGIGRDAFRYLVHQINKRSLNIIKAFISQLKIFSNLPEDQIKRLAEVAVQHQFKDNIRIICEGDEGVLLYIIKEGEAVAKLQGAEKFRLIAGEMFGEAEVLGDDNIRKFSVYSVGDTRVLSLSIQNIHEILGENFKEVIYKNQARNSLLSSKYTKHLSRDSVNQIIEKFEWRKIRPGDLPLESPVDVRAIYVVCMGTLISEKLVYEDHNVIGIIQKKKDKSLDGVSLKAINEVVLGIITIDKIEIITKMHWDDLLQQLNNMRILKKIDFFSVLSHSKIRYIASVAKHQSFEKKEVIFQYSEDAKTIYVIKSGKVKIHYHGKKLRILGKYEIFGDNCLQENTRSTNAKALKNTKCLIITGENLLEVIDYETGYKMQKTKSYLSCFYLYELLLVREIRKTKEKYCFLSFVNEIQMFYYVEVIEKNKVITKGIFKQLLHEKSIAISIEHPLILRLVKTFSDSEFIYIIYESFIVNDFSVILNKPLTEEHAKFMAAALLSILEYFHERNIIYREFNPLTLCLTNYGYPFISNFHSAKIVRDRTNTRLDVNPYTAPEMIIGEGYTKSINFWNLGIMIYQFLYNTLPFNIIKSDHPFDMSNKILKNELFFPSNSKFIRANELISTLLQKDYKIRAGLDEVKYSRWLDSIDWQRIKTLGYEAPIKPKITFNRQANLSKCMSLTRYVHEMTKKDTSQCQIPQKISKNLNWDKFF